MLAPAQAMLDAICEGVRVGLEGGETRVHVQVAREVKQGNGLVQTEFMTVEGFACADPECDRPHHVRVHSATPRYEWPDHREHRG